MAADSARTLGSKAVGYSSSTVLVIITIHVSALLGDRGSALL
ncbi:MULTISPECIES: hypothetical protein [Cyanophyceae]|nr:MULTISPECIES: hypothetical protein [Cyanophyceae]